MVIKKAKKKIIKKVVKKKKAIKKAKKKVVKKKKAKPEKKVIKKKPKNTIKSGSKKEELSKILHEITEVGEIDGAAIITRDGLLIASEVSDSMDEEIFAAMSATLFGASETALNELGKGLVERVIVESRETKLLAVSAGANAILIVLVKPKANIGLLILETKKTVSKIEVSLK